MAARYLLDAKHDNGLPRDPVARFHLGNGAQVFDIHADADTSPNGRLQSCGAMVNYHYDLSKTEKKPCGIRSIPKGHGVAHRARTRIRKPDRKSN